MRALFSLPPVSQLSPPHVPSVTHMALAVETHLFSNSRSRPGGGQMDYGHLRLMPEGEENGGGGGRWGHFNSIGVGIERWPLAAIGESVSGTGKKTSESRPISCPPPFCLSESIVPRLNVGMRRDLGGPLPLTTPSQLSPDCLTTPGTACSCCYRPKEDTISEGNQVFVIFHPNGRTARFSLRYIRQQ
jgi:hypothetical protein